MALAVFKQTIVISLFNDRDGHWGQNLDTGVIPFTPFFVKVVLLCSKGNPLIALAESVGLGKPFNPALDNLDLSSNGSHSWVVFVVLVSEEEDCDVAPIVLS